MSEIEQIIESGGPQSDLQQLIIEFYRKLDSGLEQVANEIDPKHTMVVSDHGQAPYLERVNINTCLREIGYQEQDRDLAAKPKSLAIEFASKTLPQSIKQVLTDAAPSVVESLKIPNADWQKSEAFSVRYIPGIYINDERRFGGPVNESDVSKLSKKILEEVNDFLSGYEELSAELYRTNYQNVNCYDLLPDIWINHSDSQFFGVTGDSFIEPNSDYGLIDDLSRVNRDMYTGIKGRYPLLCVSSGLNQYVGDEEDTTAAYHILRRFLDDK